MIIKSVEIEKFRAFEQVSFSLGRRITVISGRNATQKTTLLGMIGQPFTISKGHPMYGCKTIDGYAFRSQFNEKFKISPEHDVIGDHKWKLNFHAGVYTQDHYTVMSIPRPHPDREPTLRFWNAEGHSRGTGYVQLPVYFLSLSRLLPIGESKKTASLQTNLTQDELEYFIEKYCRILSIQNMSGSPTVGLEKGKSVGIFAGVSDATHDIFTNSAGEGNVSRIILAVLSFKRLKEQHGRDYKGGVLLIDEVDATLYSFSQTQLVDYLWNAAGEYKIQIVFTTHSPIILKCVNKHLQKERQRKGINLPLDAYDSAIIYLEPQYDRGGKRTIMPRNISATSDLNGALNDIALSIPTDKNKIRIYCEDACAIAFLRYALYDTLKINLDLYMSFINVNLGWTNYAQLAEKKVPEFLNNIVILDGDVRNLPGWQKWENTISEANNFLFLPLVIEKDIFELLKDAGAFCRFREEFSPVQAFTYDICFNSWPDGVKFETNDFKHWYKQTKEALGNENVLFAFWCNEHCDELNEFVKQFITVFNELAEKNEVDGLPPAVPTPKHEENEIRTPEEGAL